MLEGIEFLKDTINYVDSDNFLCFSFALLILNIGNNNFLYCLFFFTHYQDLENVIKANKSSKVRRNRTTSVLNSNY